MLIRALCAYLLSTSALATPQTTHRLAEHLRAPERLFPEIRTERLLPAEALGGIVNDNGYELIEVPSDGVEQFMPIGRREQNGIPEVMEGIWWISVNPFGGEILGTFGGPASRFDQATRTVYQDNFGPGAYSYDANVDGTRAFLNVLFSKMVFEIEFSEDFLHADLRLSVELFGERWRIPDSLLKYTMDYAEDGVFNRQSWFFGQRVGDYQLRRVVKADGSRDPAYAEYLKSAPATSYVAVKIP